MITYSVEHNLAAFNGRLREYIATLGKAPVEAVQRQSNNLGIFLSQRLRALAPDKGAVRAEMLARLKAGQGVKVRPSVVATINKKFEGKSSVKRGGKRLNLQALRVHRELGLRESGRGYTGFIARFAGIQKMEPGGRESWLGRYKQTVGRAGLEANAAGSQSSASMELAWTDSALARPGEALDTPAAQQALAGALAASEADMKQHLETKAAEAAAKL